MKRLGLVFAVFLAGCSAARITAPQAENKHKLVDHTITLTFTQSTVNNGFCSATVTASCISGFNEGYLSGTNQVQQHTDTTAVCTAGTTQPLNCTTTYTGLLPIGLITFYATTTFVDQNGVAGVTAAGTFPPVQVGADPLVPVKATVQ